MKRRLIYITKTDMETLRALIAIYGGNGTHLDRLEEELDRARIVNANSIPSNVVTLNSEVHIRDLNSGEERTLTLVSPNKLTVAKNAVSIMAPVGAALIGQREGDEIEWIVPAGVKRYQILSVLYQPERSNVKTLFPLRR